MNGFIVSLVVLVVVVFIVVSCGRIGVFIVMVGGWCRLVRKCFCCSLD